MPFTEPHLPDVRVIARHRLESEEPDWTGLAERLGRKRVLLVWGQGARPSERAVAALSAFAESFDAVIIADHLANLHVDGRIDNPLAFLRMAAAKAPEFKPDVVITFGGNVVFKDELKGFLNGSDHEHWRVDPDGAIADPFRTLTDVFQCRPEYFLERIVAARTDHRPAGRMRVACSRSRTRYRRRRRNTANWR